MIPKRLFSTEEQMRVDAGSVFTTGTTGLVEITLFLS